MKILHLSKMLVATMMVCFATGCTHTDFAPKFSETAFRKLKKGDSLDSVYNAIGAPLRVTMIATEKVEDIPEGVTMLSNNFDIVGKESQNPSRFVVLHYSLPRDKETAYHRYDIHVCKSKVIDLVDEYYTEGLIY